MRHKVERTLLCVKVIKIKNIPKKEREACRMEVRRPSAFCYMLQEDDVRIPTPQK